MIKLITAIFLALGVITSESFAGVRSIVSDSSNSDVAVSGNSNGNDYTYEEPSYDLDPAVQCQNSGFARRGCPSVPPIGECLMTAAIMPDVAWPNINIWPKTASPPT